MSPAVGGEGIALDCPAKINLLLRVGPARADWGGRHRLDTIYSAVSILDRVELRPREPGSGFRLHMEGEHLGDLANNDADPHANLAVKALLAMAQATGHQPDVAIRIIKRIPVGAGLAGGSTDAAGTMLGLNRLWKLELGAADLDEIAAGLGADLPAWWSQPRLGFRPGSGALGSDKRGGSKFAQCRTDRPPADRRL